MTRTRRYDVAGSDPFQENVLSESQDEACEILPRAQAQARKAWQAQSTARNLQLIGTALAQRNVDVGWITEICQQLEKQ